MISSATFLISVLVMIVLFIGGLYAVYKENVLGFVISGFATLTTIVLTLLSGFGRVGDVSNIALYNYTFEQSTMSTAAGVGVSTVQTITTLIDSSLVYLTAFVSVMMVVVLIFVIGRYIATLALMRKPDNEEE